MAKIRYLAIKAEDQEKTATFYKETFGMTEAWRGPVREDGHGAIYLTDGYINMAILPARRYVCGQNPERQDTRRPSCGAADEV